MVRILFSINLSSTYYSNNQLIDALNILKTLDINELNNNEKIAYYNDLIHYYIDMNDEFMLEQVWKEAQDSLEELKKSSSIIYKHILINYNNFKGLYEESNQILLEIDNENNEKNNHLLLSKAKVYFNIGREDEAKK